MKMSFNKGTDQKLDFPLTQESIDSLKVSRLVNPMVGKHHGFGIPEDFDIHESTAEIQLVRNMVERGEFPWEFMKKYYPFEGEFPRDIPMPLVYEGLHFQNPKGLANIVHMDSPSDAPKAIASYIRMTGANVKDWTPNYVNFLETVPDVEENMTDGIKLGLRKAFESKYYFGLQRPEEIAKEGKFMTAYPEGCPCHPSFPAGHGAAVAGGARRIIGSYQKLPADVLKQVLDTAYIWAMARSLAGVHHAIDNVAGLIAGGLDKYFRDEVLALYKK